MGKTVPISSCLREASSAAMCAQEADVVNSLNYSINSSRRKTEPCTQLVFSFRELSVI